MSISSIVNLRENLLHPPANWMNRTDEDLEVLARYSVYLAELVECLQATATQWENYLDQLHSQSVMVSYQAPNEA